MEAGLSAPRGVGRARHPAKRLFPPPLGPDKPCAGFGKRCAGWELDPAHDPKALNLKFHPGTSILLVSGSTDAIMVTQSVIGQLKRNPEVLPKPEQKSPPAPGAEKK